MTSRTTSEIIVRLVFIFVCALITTGERTLFSLGTVPASQQKIRQTRIAQGSAAEVRSPPNQTKPSTTVSEHDVKSLIESCFGGLFRLDKSALSPAYVSGDFDGDGVDDLFVTAQLARKVSKTDKSVPPFNLQNVFGTGPLPQDRAYYDLRMDTLALAGEGKGPLFLLVHGFPKRAGRCQGNEKLSVLMFAMYKGTTTIRVFKAKRLPRGTIGDPKEDQPPPRLKGTAILLLDKAGSGTALYWDGSRYRWYPYH
jgi:hypothetical protein